MDFKGIYDKHLNLVSRALDGYAVEKDTPERTIYGAMRYSLMAGGKRLRPVLSIAVCELLGGNMEEVIPFACAIEMIHTYSLIHDDLPAMDNDDYRRGRLTNHKVFGEAIAILAGDALLNYAFEIMLNAAQKNHGNILAKVKAMGIIADSAGPAGMIGGQVVDLESENKEISGEMLRYMHKCKTGAIIKASVMSAAAICSASEGSMKCLEQYAEKIGLAFQVKDDIMDIEGSFELMGKAAGSDNANKKSTFVSLYGLEESKKMLSDLTNEAVSALDVFGEKAGFLIELARYLENRDK